MWPESFSSNLPPPHADEPASLRQDIADELADHLAAAAAEERAHGAAEAAAREAALNRFGDPAAVARQLWLEAMKEPIMRQRTLMVAAALLVLGVFAANGLAWMAFQQLRESNAALVARLEAASGKTEPGQFADLTVKLVKDDAAASPAEGYPVTLHGYAVERRIADNGAHGGVRPMLLKEVSNAQGIARFTPILSGNYRLSVTTPTGWELSREVALLARPWTEKIAVPSQAPETANVTVAIRWPDDFQNEKLVLGLSFHSTGDTIAKSGDWTPSSSTFSMLRDALGNAPRTEARTLNGMTLGDFRPPEAPLQVTAAVYEARAYVYIEKADHTGNESQYAILLKITEEDLRQSRFVANPGDNTWQIALTPQGIERVRAALAEASASGAEQ